MAQKFIGLDDAATQLGATKDQLNALRESGKLRGYRDGASWKFRTEEIDALAESGLPTADEGSSDSLSLDTLSEGLDSESLSLSDDDLGIDFGDSDEGVSSPESDLDLAAVDEPTTPANEDEVASTAGDQAVDDEELILDDSDDDAESILLTDASVGGSPDRPPSTIIGKSELASSDDDLELAASDSNVESAAMSDVKLSSDEDLSDIGAVSSEEASPDAASQFEGLEELEIDLEAESSRILEAEDLKAAQAAAKQNQEKKTDDALDSDLGLVTGSDAASLTGLSALGGGDFELAADSSPSNDPSVVGNDDSTGKKGPGSSAVLSDDENDDFVLGSESDSDVTLSGADSGINLVPSDSGLALDDASLDLTGAAAAGSSLDLSESFGAALTDGGDDSQLSDDASGSEDFLLQPANDAESDLEEDSSQIIALEEVVEEDDDGVVLGDDLAAGFGAQEVMGSEAVPAGAVAAAEETQFGGLTIGFLACALTAMAFCGILSIDMIRTIWSWEEPSSISSGMLESLANLLSFRN